MTSAATADPIAFAKDFAIGGVSGAIAKTCTAPIERVKLIIQTQDSNPRIINGEVPRYTGIGNAFSRVYAEQGLGAFWRGNFTNVLRYFPTQAFNFAFKDSIKTLFPKTNKDTPFLTNLGINMASGGLAGAGSLTIVYPLDYARTRLASDVGSGKRTFNGLGDCLRKTVQTSGVRGLYNGFGVSVMGIIPYRGVYFGLYDTFKELNPYKKDRGVTGVVSKRRLQMQPDKPKVEWMYRGTIDCFGKVIMNEGAAALFKGAGANALRTVGSAMVLVLYDQIKLLME
ncbi:ADP,ATP carrier protein [Sphaeroforma arctica JP610]|uniref:ADP/ATP translocase n=1 Tax=Sphaeroforma arctica JP610 TaxID=667725 RepID=A0A0L0FDM9_9EUKA|nr:ADP,ATP carrier protein [Sphaeroforma arctica JP610]KNC74879.1 ADP,ATP carrier protein [Sphaeroforma arctica JP610]|eukprot:XP_014148781.1 ADP,ATP carrier protein [Sphaeroforma arctica JP610]